MAAEWEQLLKESEALLDNEGAKVSDFLAIKEKLEAQINPIDMILAEMNGITIDENKINEQLTKIRAHLLQNVEDRDGEIRLGYDPFLYDDLETDEDLGTIISVEDQKSELNSLKEKAVKLQNDIQSILDAYKPQAYVTAPQPLTLPVGGLTLESSKQGLSALIVEMNKKITPDSAASTTALDNAGDAHDAAVTVAPLGPALFQDDDVNDELFRNLGAPANEDELWEDFDEDDDEHIADEAPSAGNIDAAATYKPEATMEAALEEATQPDRDELLPEVDNKKDDLGGDVPPPASDPAPPIFTHKKEIIKQFVKNRLDILRDNQNEINPKNKEIDDLSKKARKKLAKFYDVAIPMYEKYEKLFMAEGIKTDDIKSTLDAAKANRSELGKITFGTNKKLYQSANQPPEEILIRYVGRNLRTFRNKIESFKEDLPRGNESKVEKIKSQSQQMLGEAEIFKEHMEQKKQKLVLEKNPKNKKELAQIERVLLRVNRRIHSLQGVLAVATVKLLDKQKSFKDSKYGMHDQLSDFMAKRSTFKTLDSLDNVTKLLATYEMEKQALTLKVPPERLAKIDKRIASLEKIKLKIEKRLEDKDAKNKSGHDKLNLKRADAEKKFQGQQNAFDAKVKDFEDRLKKGEELPNASKITEVIAQVRKSLTSVSSLADKLKKNEAMVRCTALIDDSLDPKKQATVTEKKSKEKSEPKGKFSKI